MKIIRLESENIKRLHAVEIKPDGSLIIIGGKNAQGKTSILDSIEYALAGGSSIPSKPIHKGEKKARIVVDLGQIIVTRTFTDGSSKLVVSDKEGFPKSSPQALLDSLVGKLSFDPLAFSRMDAKGQLETLKNMVGIDFSKLDGEKEKIYQERTQINREVKSLQSQVQAIQKYESVPKGEVSILDLVNEQEERIGRNRGNLDERNRLIYLEGQIFKSQTDLDDLREQIKKLREKWDRATNDHNVLKIQREEQLERVNSLEDVDTNSILIQISQSEEINQKVRSNLKRSELQFDLELRQQQVEKITRRLEEIESEKSNLIASSNLLIPNLTFNENGVLFNGLPLDQASSAELLIISSSIGLALNPKLKILLLRDGSLLDEDHLKTLAKWADQNDAQVWLETVSEGKECQVIIEDGRVKV